MQETFLHKNFVFSAFSVPTAKSSSWWNCQENWWRNLGNNLMPHSVYVFRGVHLPQSVDRSVEGLDFSTPPFFSDVSEYVGVKCYLNLSPSLAIALPSLVQIKRRSPASSHPFPIVNSHLLRTWSGQASLLEVRSLALALPLGIMTWKCHFKSL